jgi:hypothetical protein
MNRLALILASVMALLVVSAFPYGVLGQAVPFSTTLSRAYVGCHLQYAEYRSPGLFDRGSCELSCRDRYGGPSTWTGDRSQSGTSMDYFRCSYECDIRDRNNQERSRKLY